MFLCLWVRRAADCIVEGSFRASHRLGRRISDCVVASRVWGCVGGCYNVLVFFGCVVRLTASWEDRLGRRIV